MDTIKTLMDFFSNKEKVTIFFGFIFLVIMNIYFYLKYKRIISTSKKEKSPFLWKHSLIKATQHLLQLIIILFFLYIFITIVIRKYCYFKEFKQGFQLLLLSLLIMILFKSLKDIENDVAYGRRKNLKSEEKTKVERFFLFAKIFTLFIGLIVTLNIFNVNISSILAIGGIGGIFFSLAARDLFTNLFSGMVLFIERNFDIGDFIKSERNIEGTVEHINSHSTIVRHIDQSLLTIPNQELTRIIVQNFSRMKYQLLQIKIPLTYEDFNKLEDILNEIDAILKKHPQINTEKEILIFLEGFEGWALNISIQAYINLGDGVRFEYVRHEIYLNILKMIQEKNANIYLSTSKVYLSSSEEKLELDDIRF